MTRFTLQSTDELVVTPSEWLYSTLQPAVNFPTADYNSAGCSVTTLLRCGGICNDLFIANTAKS